MRRSLLPATLAILLGWPQAAPARAPDAPMTSRLDNGLTLVVEPRPGASTYGLAVLARGGSAEDDDEEIGLTALVAGMLLRGSLSMSGERQARVVDGLGARLEPIEGRISVGLRSSGPAEAMPRVLEVITDAIRHPRLDPGDVAGQREVLRRALGTSLDSPSTLLWRGALPSLFPSHPLGRLADPESYLRSVDARLVRRSHEARFTGRRTVVAVTGPWRFEQIRDLVAGGLGRLSPGEAAPVSLATPAPLPSPAPRLRVRHRSSQAELLIATPTPGLAPEDAGAMDLLSQILAGADERLYRRLREERGWAYWVAPVDWRYPGAGLFGVRTALDRKHVEEARDIILDEIRRLGSEAPSAREVDSARRHLLTTFARTWQRAGHRAMALAAAALREEPLPGLEPYRSRLDEVSPDRIRDLARRLAGSGDLAVVVLR